MKTTLTYFAILSLGLVAFLSAQDTEVSILSENDHYDIDAPIPENSLDVSLNENGKLVGNVFQGEQAKTPVTARVTISTLKGEVLAAGNTTEDGDFEFDAIEPGYYSIVGIAPGFYGDQVINVQPHNDGFLRSVPIQMDSGVDMGVFYHTNHNLPLSTFSTDGYSFSGTPVYSSGGFSSGGFSSGGRGRLFRGRGRGRLLGGGLQSLLPFVGLVGLAGLDDDDDASPTM